MSRNTPLRRKPPYPCAGWAAVLLLVPLPLWAAAAGEGVTVPPVIRFDLGRLDDRGLQGPPDGLRSLDYEYCIPEGGRYREQVAAIDPSARFMPGSPGRIGCRPGQVLVLGNTHQPGFRDILWALADLPFVERILESLFE